MEHKVNGSEEPEILNKVADLLLDDEDDGAEMNALSRAALDQVEAMREARTRLGESGATDRAAAIAEELIGTPRA